MTCSARAYDHCVPTLDTHLHLWDPAHLSYPWLDGDLDRRFGPDEYRAAWAGAPAPAASVFVQAECDPRHAHDEVAWVAGIAEDCGIRGIVAHSPLEHGERVAHDLDRLIREPLVVGVRRSLQDEDPGFARRPDVVAGARLLAERGLRFDACVRPAQLADVSALADAVPGLAIVLDHLGKPAVGSASRPVDPRGSDWHRDLVDLARRPSVHVKLSGLPAEALDAWSAAQIEPFLDVALEAFGPERLLYGGDWPVSERQHPRRWLEAVDAWALDRLGPAGRDAVLAANGEGFYFGSTGRSRSPETPPSTSRTTPVVEADSGLTR